MHYDLEIQYVVTEKENNKVLYVKTEKIDNLEVDSIGKKVIQLKKYYQNKFLFIKIE